jgi:hypothetical protein
MPDGSVLYGADTRYDFRRGHLFEFSAGGRFLAAYDFGWDTTAAVFQSDGRTHVVIKDNHYDEKYGNYCLPLPSVPVSEVVCAATGVDAGPFYITQLDARLRPEWRFQNTNTESCARQPDGSLHCVSDQPNGFEWCINAPAVDEDGTVYANSEDGNLYAIPQGRRGVFNVPRQRTFLRLALSAAYTPLAISPSGLLFTENAGHLFVLGRARPA